MITTSFNRRQFRWTFILIEYDFEIKYRVEKINFVDDSSRRLNYENEKNENICLFILQNKLKNVTIAILCVASIITRNAFAKKINFENDEFAFFRIMKIIDFDEKIFFNDDERKIVFDANAQQFRRNEIQTMCDDKNYYEFFFDVLKNKLINM